MTTRWILAFQAMDPRNPEKVWEVGIPEWLYRKHQNNGNDKALGRLFLIADVLQGGTLEIREGWSRPGKDSDCYAYCGQPKREFKSPKIETPPPPGMAFVVFIQKDGSIDEWTWRVLSEEDGGSHPKGVKGEIIWPLNKKSESS